MAAAETWRPEPEREAVPGKRVCRGQASRRRGAWALRRDWGRGLGKTKGGKGKSSSDSRGHVEVIQIEAHVFSKLP